MVRLLTPTDYRSMPWQNGAGRTTEIAAHPPGAALDAFLWRVSLADVECDGPFSPFPGIDRTIVLLEGLGMRLHGEARDIELTTRFAPHTFSGDEAIGCALVAGPVRDFNAMFRRGRAHGNVVVVRDGGAEVGPAQFRLAYAATGAQECSVARFAPLRLEAGHALLVDEPGGRDGSPLAMRPLGAGAVALVVSVDCP
jgi:hypothetical protein